MNLVAIIGPTASGKTKLSALLADKINGEIISADSRQVYKDMNIGTGKDYDDYFVNGKEIPFHLIDICNAGTEYNVFEYQKDFIDVFNDIIKRKKTPVLCGGSGLYIEAVLKGYKLINVPVNPVLRAELGNKSLAELTQIITGLKTLHNITDIVSKKRAVRAIEIEKYYLGNPLLNDDYPEIIPLIFGVRLDRDETRRRITERLHKRLDSGMIDEVKTLLEKGIDPENLIYYGLEYKYITLYLLGNLGYAEMTYKLNIAIHQFSKRQMTWFRRMEKSGAMIHWIDGALDDDSKIRTMLSIIRHDT